MIVGTRKPACGLLTNHAFHSWLKKILTPVYDSRDVPIDHKEGITIGMSMTERQGGSVRADANMSHALDYNSTLRIYQPKYLEYSLSLRSLCETANVITVYSGYVQ